ncbi:uncharacterized protein MICPUCDRAFT_53289 [Micromonas pusilla CCMP1545]|uniref:Predicted protein n=1 Tax=Micromonas pusilla (strain CCMP1545) TaxID=564608 RepID=C1N6H5_MICPC|nr:uncharacterized protein MICPUCDRAFT_53289 [Micromonas pusilla CCMP1545]EEH52475.1 predicted protein [Micromonas pusilla CCMP1545]|eukprot:XP_003063339.1 predicted protein [Micromonas pusilla CCMP1545]
MSRPQEFKNRPGNVAKVVTFDSTQQQVAVYEASDPNEGKTGDPVKDLEAKLNYITEAVPLVDNIVAGSTAGAGSGAFCHLTPVPIRPRRRGERDPLRTFSPGVSLRPSRVPRF